MKKEKPTKNYEQFLIKELSKLFEDKLTSIVLFGSRIRNLPNEFSDLDVVVVLDNFDRLNKNALLKVKKEFLLTCGIKLDLHLFTKKDAEDNFNHYSPLFTTLLLGNKIIFDKDNFIKSLYNEFVKNILINDIKYYEKGKIWEMRKVAKNLENLH